MINAIRLFSALTSKHRTQM